MLTTLIGSRPQASGGAAGAVVSVVIHGALIVMAVVETTQMAAPTHDTPDVTPVVYFPPRPAKPGPRAPAPPATTRPIHRSIGSAEPVIREPIPGPVPTGPTRVNEGVPMPEQGAGVASGGNAEPSGVPTSVASGDGNASGASMALTGDEVERAVQAIRPVPPRYPEMLRAAGMTGTVRVRFVVDTIGIVEPGSIEMLESPHGAFGEAVRRALLATRYHPAEANGQRVRQLVEQAFRFQLER